MECIIRDDACSNSDMVTALQKNICRAETIYLTEKTIVSEEIIKQGKGNIRQELYPNPGKPAVRDSLKRYWHRRNASEIYHNLGSYAVFSGTE